MFTQGMKEKYGNLWNIKQVLEKSKVQRDVFRSQGKITRNTFIAYWAKTKSVLDFGYVTLNSSKFADYCLWAVGLYLGPSLTPYSGQV